MRSPAFRSDCNKRLVVTKKHPRTAQNCHRRSISCRMRRRCTRGRYISPNGLDRRHSTGRWPQGLKPNFLSVSFTARLKSCPDTKHQAGDSPKTGPFRRILDLTIKNVETLDPGLTSWAKFRRPADWTLEIPFSPTL